MAASAVRLVWEKSQAKNGALLVLLAIADEIDKDGRANVSVREIAAKARLTDRAVQLAVRELDRLGELSVSAKIGGGGRNSYRVAVRRGENISPLGGEESSPPKNFHPEKSSPPKPDIPQASPARGENISPPQISDNVVTTTGRSLVAVKDVSAKPPRADERPDVDRLCEHLADRIAADGSKRPAITKKWRDAARLLIDKDGRTEEQVRAAIDWSQDSEFWRANILSMPKLREKYTTLQKQASRGSKPKPNANENLGYIADYMKRNGVDI